MPLYNGPKLKQQFYLLQTIQLQQIPFINSTTELSEETMNQAWEGPPAKQTVTDQTENFSFPLK